MTLDDAITLIENRFRQQILDISSMLHQLEWLNDQIKARLLLHSDIIKVTDHNPVLFVEDPYYRDYLTHTIQLNLPGRPLLERGFTVRTTENGEFQSFIDLLFTELKEWLKTQDEPPEALRELARTLPAGLAKGLEFLVINNSQATPKQLADAGAIATRKKEQPTDESELYELAKSFAQNLNNKLSDFKTGWTVKSVNKIFTLVKEPKSETDRINSPDSPA